MFDDTFMSAMFDGKKEETEFLVQVILNRNDIEVLDSKAQFFISNIYGRGLRLDILAKGQGFATALIFDKGWENPFGQFRYIFISKT